MDTNQEVDSKLTIHDNTLGEAKLVTYDTQDAVHISHQQLRDMVEMLEFFKVFIERNPEAKEIMTALRAKKRIL